MTKELARNSRNSGIEPLFGWDPFSSFFSRRAVDRLFGGGSPFAGLSDAFESDFGVRIKDDGNLKQFQYALPGISKENIHIDIVDNVLTVRVLERDEQGERSYYSKVTLDPSLDLENVTADSKDGLLVVSVPIKAKSSRHIPINVGGGSSGELESEAAKASSEPEAGPADDDEADPAAVKVEKHGDEDKPED